MTLLFYIKVKVGKFFANVCSMFVRNREKRHRLRNRLDPLNPERCIRYLKDRIQGRHAAEPRLGLLAARPGASPHAGSELCQLHPAQPVARPAARHRHCLQLCRLRRPVARHCRQVAAGHHHQHPLLRPLPHLCPGAPRRLLDRRYVPAHASHSCRHPAVTALYHAHTRRILLHLDTELLHVLSEEQLRHA